MSDDLFSEEFEEQLLDEVEAELGIDAREFIEENREGPGSYREAIYREADRKDLNYDELYRQEMIDAVLDELENNRDEYGW